MRQGTITAVGTTARPWSKDGKNYEAYQVTIQGPQGIVTGERNVMAGNLPKLQALQGKRVLFDTQSNNYGVRFTKLDDASAPQGGFSRNKEYKQDPEKARHIFVQGIIQSWMTATLKDGDPFPGAEIDQAVEQTLAIYQRHFGEQPAQPATTLGAPTPNAQQNYAPQEPPQGDPRPAPPLDDEIPY